MPLESREDRILDAIKARLDLITGASYLTAPTVAVGLSTDAVAQGNVDRLRLDYSHTESFDDSTGSHGSQAVYHVWCASGNTANPRKQVRRLKADVLRTLYAGERDLMVSTLASYGIREHEFTPHPDFNKQAGTAVFVLVLRAAWATGHAEDP